MSLVGELIMQLRRRIPDAPQVYPQPGTPTITGTTLTGGQFGGGPGAPDYFFKVSVTNEFGESLATPEIGPVILSAGQNAFQINWTGVAAPLATPNFQPYMKVYWGIFSGQENLFQLIPFVSGVSVYNLLSGQNFQTGIPPTRSTMFFPGSDGNFLSAAAAFDLLNEALGEMVRIAGGIIDVTGVQSNINQSMYRLDSPFYQFVNAWYDGYPMDVVPRSFMYLRNSAAGFSGILSYEQDGPQSVIQVWPQSNRIGGATTLWQNMTATDNYAVVSNAAGFLSIGLAQIDNEIVAYSSISTLGPPSSALYQLNGITRGLGGTDPAAHIGAPPPNGAPVTELNIRLSGYRMARLYGVGDSELTIQVPQAWERPLVLHMLSQVRSMEQDDQNAKSLMGDFVQMADKIAKQSRMGKLKPRQIPIWGQNTSDARNVNGIGFGWLIN
jgi:hypothetical protein